MPFGWFRPVYINLRSINRFSVKGSLFDIGCTVGQVNVSVKVSTLNIEVGLVVLIQVIGPEYIFILGGTIEITVSDDGCPLSEQ